MEILVSIIGAIGVVALIIFYGALAWGYVIHTFYGWFILTALPELPHFTILQFMGFSLFLNVLIRHSNVSIKDEYRDKNNEYLTILLGPWIVLSMGWVIKIILF